MSAGDRDTLTDAIIQELREHEHNEYFGDCRYHDQVDDYHEHVAAALEPLIAARVRAACKKAWEEGHDAVFDHAVDWEGWLNIDGRYTQDALPNPYRLDAGDEFQNPED